MNEIRYDEQLVAELFDAQPQPVFWMKPVFDSRGQIIDFEYAYCNDEMYRFTGVAPEQLLGTRVTQTPTLMDDVRQGIFLQIRDVYQTGKKYQDTLYNEKLGKYYSFLRSKIQDGVLTIIQDRNEEYRMINELARQKSLFDSVLKSSSSGITVTKFLRNDKGEVTDIATVLANEGAAAQVGLTKEILLSKKIGELDADLLNSEIYYQCLDTLRTGAPCKSQLFLRAPDRWLEVSISRLDNDHLVNIFTDITAEKKRQIEFERMVERMQVVFDSSQAGMFTLQPLKDENGNILDFIFGLANERVAVYIGETASDLKGSLASIYFPAYKENGLFDIYVDTLVNDKVYDFDFHYDDGYDVFFHIHTVKSGDEVFVTFTDQTTLKRTQRELEATIQELRRSNSHLEEFAYAASHDLKEPIRKIHYFSERLKATYAANLDAEGIKTFERMQAATERMKALVEDLLSYSQVSMRPRSLEEVDLKKLVIGVLADLELQIEDKQAVVKVGELPVVNGYESQLQQLFQNLIANSLKYVRAGVRPEIEVSSEVVQGKDVPGLSAGADARSFFSITIRDNGIGFDQKDADRIFNIFQRLHGNAEYAGTGVGLSIARKVVENHDGFIQATSVPGQGASFRILIPEHRNR